MQSIYLPHCRSCRMEWPELLLQLPVSFRKMYQARMEHILFLKEQTYLPLLQPTVLYNAKLKEMRLSLKNITEQKCKNDLCEDQLVSTQRERNRLLTNEYNKIEHAMTILKKNPPLETSTVPLTHCPIDSCRGFISSSFQCGLCFVNVCASCIKVHDTCECVPRQTISCPHCQERVYQTECDTTFCFHCHKGFSWTKGKELAIQPKLIEPVALENGTKRPTITGLVIGLGLLRHVIYEDYVKVHRYYRNIRHLRRFVMEKYQDSHMSINGEHLAYLQGGDKAVFSKICYAFHMSRYRRQLEQRLVAHFILEGENLIQKLNVSNETEHVRVLVTELDELSQHSITELGNLDKTYPYKGIVLKKNFSV